MLAIISYNIRGITTYSKQASFRNWLNESSHDVVLLQELHMTQMKHLEVFKKSFPEYNVICSLGTWLAGGTLIMIKRRYEIIDSGTDSEGRIASVKIIYNGTPVAIVSVYAPAQATERCSFFTQLRLYIPSAEWTLIGGDFNCVPNKQHDRKQLGLHNDNQSYLALLQQLVHPLLLTEIFRFKHPRRTVYSFHSESTDTHSRIDLFFGSQMVRENTQKIFYSPVGISDHDCLTIQLKIPVSKGKEHRRWICNARVIQRSTLMEKFSKMWNIFLKSADFNTTIWWSDFKASLTILLPEEEKQLRNEIRRELRELQLEYRLRMENPTDDNLIRMDIIRKDIGRLLEEKAKNNLPERQELSIKGLSNLAKSHITYSKTNQSKISFLQHPFKGLVDTSSDMVAAASLFYKELYDIKPIDTSCWDELFTDIPSLNKNDRDALSRDITFSECYSALMAIPTGHSPGDDGITVEVWRLLFPIVGEHYVRMINTANSNSYFHNGFLNALLILLKKDYSNDGSMKSFRPISLMNIDYKILSKVLSLRVRKILSNIIHQNQTCSIPERTIHDNVHTIRSIIEHYSRVREPIGLVQWDQEKAFDRINHEYLLETLRRFGFGPNFINWIKLLYSNATFRIKVNNSISNVIPFKSGVRQGCSLSGALYVLCLEPLLHHIRRNPRIPGVLPPGGQFTSIIRSIFNTDHAQVMIKVLAYADDVSTFVFNNEHERSTKAAFQLYNKASGGRTNEDKTLIFWCCSWSDPPLFQSRVNRNWCYVLGIPIDTKVKLPAAELTRMVSSMRRQITKWSGIELTLFERATVLKTFIASRLVYVLSLMPVSNRFIDNLQKEINSYFWSSKRPAINFKTCIGKKEDGGCALLHLNTMITSLRIKCGLKVIDKGPKIWKFYAFQHSSLALYSYAPWTWSNLVPHFNDATLFFGEVALQTSKWFKEGKPTTKTDAKQNIYWCALYRYHFQQPTCYQRNPHLTGVPLFKQIHNCGLPSFVIEFWFLLANYGINTRSRLGRNTSERKCYYCEAAETITHLFVECPFFDNVHSMLRERIKQICGFTISRDEETIIYLGFISRVTTGVQQKQIAYLIGNFLYGVWRFRRFTAVGNSPNPIHGCIKKLESCIRYMPYDNG